MDGDAAAGRGQATSRQLQLARVPASASAARRALAELAGHITASRLEDARLLLSELVTNAVRHAGPAHEGQIVVLLQGDDRGLRVEVRDPGPGFEPVEPAKDLTRPSGWGLYLVRELADRWGVERGDASCVWFELDR